MFLGPPASSATIRHFRLNSDAVHGVPEYSQITIGPVRFHGGTLLISSIIIENRLRSKLISRPLENSRRNTILSSMSDQRRPPTHFSEPLLMSSGPGSLIGNPSPTIS